MLLQTATQLDANPIKRGGKYIVRVTGAAGLTVTLTMGTRKVTGVVDDTGECYLTVTKPGLYTVTSMYNDNQVYTSELLVGTQDVIAYKPFGACTPEEIQAFARSGYAKKFWNVGDSVKITLTNDETIEMEILDFDHDCAEDGETTLPLTLGMKNLLKTTYTMNQGAYTNGGWAGCYFRNNSLPTLKNLFPSNWQAVMTKCQKKSSAGNGVDSLTITLDDLFLLSEIEVHGDAMSTFFMDGEGKQYTIFENKANLLKYKNDVPADWWLRSSVTHLQGDWQKNYFGAVRTADPQLITGGSDANTQHGIALNFCVG